MKKRLAIVVASAMMVMMSMSMTAFAVSSPSGSATTSAEATKSPETGDMNLLFVELAGAALAVTAVAAKKRANHMA